jgi:predicted DNA-binding protein (UPF0278 family)
MITLNQLLQREFKTKKVDDTIFEKQFGMPYVIVNRKLKKVLFEYDIISGELLAWVKDKSRPINTIEELDLLIFVLTKTKNTMKTPVEFLLEKYNYITRLRKRDEISQVEADEAIARYLQHIKEMEKHHIINAYQQGAINHTDKLIDVMKESEDYYDLVFNNTKTKTP